MSIAEKAAARAEAAQESEATGRKPAAGWINFTYKGRDIGGIPIDPSVGGDKEYPTARERERAAFGASMAEAIKKHGTERIEQYLMSHLDMTINMIDRESEPESFDFDDIDDFFANEAQAI